jgi:phospholipid-binding lipoprotein MlaA
MKIFYWIYVFASICLIILPNQSIAWNLTFSSSIEASVSMSPSIEGVTMVVEMEVTAERDERPIQVALVNMPPELPKNEEPGSMIADPIEPVNRAFFHFNDKLYFWVLKPVSTGYKTIVPVDGRIGVQNFFSNLTTPIRLVNCLLQAKFKGAGNEALRFLLNTTFGIAGFLDPAKKKLKIEKQDADFGQTLGIWGMGPAFYINWPILGPSNLRDTVGYLGDLFLDPRTYVLAQPVFYTVRPFELVNETSLRIGEYEDFKQAAIDPYVALKDAYHQSRQNKTRKR